MDNLSSEEKKKSTIHEVLPSERIQSTSSEPH